MQSITFQPQLRPALPLVNGPKEYREQRALFIRLADSPLLQWFLQIGRVDGVKAFAKSTSSRFSNCIDELGLRAINAKLIALLNNGGAGVELGLAKSISFDDVYFDSTCLKAPIHFPVDWVLLRDATRTLMKATLIIRRNGVDYHTEVHGVTSPGERV